MDKILFTSESVSEGHPDKLADQIADAILDECLRLDPDSHVACEVFLTKEFVLIGGEITCKSPVDYETIARNVLREVGYVSPELGIGADTCTVEVRVHEQSSDIAQGVNRGDRLAQGAGDQGIMFGFATNESEGYMPLAICISHKLVRMASRLRKEGKFRGARPDMKSQVTIDYTDPRHPQVDTVLMSVQHDPDVDLDSFKTFIHENIMIPVIDSFGLSTDFRFFINPTGRFVIGGPDGDTGLTGRKLIVDTYGGYARHGGGAFSGKDPSKVDRSASYYARYIAKNLVASGVCEQAEIQLSYGIGIAEPLSINVNTFGTAKVDESRILEAVHRFFDARPGAIIEQFQLTRPSFSYRASSVYGCFGRPDLALPWEKMDKAESIREFCLVK